VPATLPRADRPLPTPDIPRPRTADDPRGAAAALAPMVDVWFRILADHAPDAELRCRTCTSAGTGARSTPWPCSLRTLAELARRQHADRWGERSTRGRRSLYGAQGTSCAVTPREREFLQVAAEGCTDAEIAAQLDVPELTVRTTIRRIARKLGEPDRDALLVLALRTGVIV
jgi:DNA-binding CsgD family transcriptional regulator